MNYPDDRKFKDWQRAILYWRLVKHRHGLTIPALSAITGRDQDTLWSEIKQPRYNAGAMYCFTIHAPVIIMKTEVKADYSTLGPAVYSVVVKQASWLYSSDMYDDNNLTEAEQKREIKRVIGEMMEKYPAPKYKGWRRDKGVLSFSPKLMLPALRKAAAGTLSPFPRR